MSSTPPIYDWMSKDETEFRERGESNFQDAAQQAGYTNITSFEAMQLGHSSVVYKFETPEGIFVCKLASEDKFYDDVMFYKICEEHGVPSLKVLNNIKVNENLYACFSNYINAPTLVEISEEKLLKKDKYFKVGQAIAKLHEIKGTNSKNIKIDDLKSESINSLSSMKERVLSDSMLDEVKNILSESEIQIVRDAFAYLEDYFTKGNLPSLVHGDIGMSNIFDTKPIIIFDPGLSSFSNPMLDIGLTITYLSTSPLFNEIKNQIISGYESVVVIDKKGLSAGIIINSYRKLITAIRKKNDKRITSYLNLFREESRNFQISN